MYWDFLHRRGCKNRRPCGDSENAPQRGIFPWSHIDSCSCEEKLPLARRLWKGFGIMFQFTDECKIGIEEIDNEHRYLFQLINEGISLTNNEFLNDRYEKVKEFLQRLEDYAEQHFAHEERYMEQIRDPELIHQRMQHDIFREKVRNFMFMNISEDEEQQRLLEELLNFLAKWLYHHIIGSDIMIGQLPPLEEWMIKENPCEFTEDYLTGIELIDAEHKELFRIAGKANTLVRKQVTADDFDEVMEVLQELKNYTKEHFQDEEDYMESIQYEGLEHQKRAHETFVEKIESVDLNQIDENPQEYMESLIEFLIGWLIKHILYTDKKIPKKR